MFSRFAALFFCTLVFVGATLVGAAPMGMHQHAARQIGNLQCNIDRLKVVGDVFQASQTAKTLSSQLSADTTGSSLVSTVTQGLGAASSGISDIAVALFTGQAAPAASRDQVQQGLTDAFNAASNITSGDANITSNVNKLKSQIQAAGTAGIGVLDICK